jgi:hypothetical protein
MSIFAHDVKVTVKTAENVVLKQIFAPYFVVKNQTPKGADIFLGDIALEEV